MTYYRWSGIEIRNLSRPDNLGLPFSNSILSCDPTSFPHFTIILMCVHIEITKKENERERKKSEWQKTIVSLRDLRRGYRTTHVHYYVPMDKHYWPQDWSVRFLSFFFNSLQRSRMTATQPPFMIKDNFVPISCIPPSILSNERSLTWWPTANSRLLVHFKWLWWQRNGDLIYHSHHDQNEILKSKSRTFFSFVHSFILVFHLLLIDYWLPDKI